MHVIIIHCSQSIEISEEYNDTYRRHGGGWTGNRKEWMMTPTSETTKARATVNIVAITSKSTIRNTQLHILEYNLKYRIIRPNKIWLNFFGEDILYRYGIINVYKSALEDSVFGNWTVKTFCLHVNKRVILLWEIL